MFVKSSKLKCVATLFAFTVVVSSASAQLFKGQFKERKWQKRAKHGQYNEAGGIIGGPYTIFYRDNIAWNLNTAIETVRENLTDVENEHFQSVYLAIFSNATSYQDNNAYDLAGGSKRAQIAKNAAFVYLVGLDGSTYTELSAPVREVYRNKALQYLEEMQYPCSPFASLARG